MRSVPAIILLIAACAACGRQRDQAEGAGSAASAAGAVDEAAAEARAPATKPATALESEYEAALNAFLSNCDTTKHPGVRACKGQERRRIAELFEREDRPRSVALDVLGRWLADTDPRKPPIAAQFMGSYFTTLGPNPGEIPLATSGRLIAAVKKLTHDRQMLDAVGAATVHAAMLAGDDRIWDLFANPPDPFFRWSYEHLMVHGRLRPFAKMKELAKTADVDQALPFLIVAPRKMGSATAHEIDTVCPWVQQFLGHSSESVARDSVLTMGWCGPRYIDALLAGGRRRLAAGTIKAVLNSYGEVCPHHELEARTAEGKQACEKVYAFLEAIAADTRTAPETRAYALWYLFKQDPTQATYDRLKKYTKVKELAGQVPLRDALEALRTYHGAK